MGDVQTIAPGPAEMRELRPPIADRKTEDLHDRDPVPPDRNGATNGKGPEEKPLALEGMTPTGLARRLGRRY